MAAIDRLIELLPDGLLMRVERAYGLVLKRTADHRLGYAAIQAAHRVLGRAIGATVKAPGVTPVAVAKQTMEKFFLPILQPAGADDRDYTFEFGACPYGLEAGSKDLCHAIMSLEEEIVGTIGGELVIESRIAEGAPTCRFTVRNAGSRT